MANTSKRVRCQICGLYRNRTTKKSHCPWCLARGVVKRGGGRYDVPLAKVRRLLELQRLADQGLPLFGGLRPRS